MEDDVIPSKVLLTGASGIIGRAVRPVLRSRCDEIRLVDRVAITDAAANERPIEGDIRDLDAMTTAMDGVGCVLHLAAIPDEAPWQRIRDMNIDGTFAVFEAARRAGVARVVFASSHHVSGFRPLGDPVAVADEPRPSSLYGVSKVFGEALARMYFDKFGVSFVCLRIAAYAERPTDYRQLLLWISPRDTAQLCMRALVAPGIGFLTVFGTSANTRGTYDRAGWDRLGYRPEDDSEHFLGRPAPPSDRPIGAADRYCGGITCLDPVKEETVQHHPSPTTTSMSRESPPCPPNGGPIRL
jgi:uronate dehydrogenase